MPDDLRNLAQVPRDIRESRRLVVWKKEQRAGRTTKVPYSPRHPMQHAAVNDPATWGSFDTACQVVADGQAQGIGVVLTSDDDLVGVDVDGCIEPASGTVTPDARAIVEQLRSYTEITPSGTGLRIFARGMLPPGRRVIRGRGHTGIEVYAVGKYLTVTGQHLEGTPVTIEARAPELVAFHKQVFGERRPAEPEGNPFSQPVELDDVALLASALAARNGAALAALWSGDCSAYAEDRSAADLALCNLLAFWTGRDAARMDRLFRGSELMRPKWDSRRGERTYGADTIARAIAGCTAIYQPPTTIELSDEPEPASVVIEEVVPPTTTSSSQPVTVDDGWPRLHPDAYTGLFGNFIHALEPETEADPIALLGHCLVMFGSLVGRQAHMRIGADTHYLNEHLLCVGDTGTGRKGLAYAETFGVMKGIDPDWAATRVTTGLSSGEGLIANVRDAVEDDAGIADKRLLVREPEFAKTLRVARREGCTLSAVVRECWDTGDLRVLTRHHSLAATGAHICIVGHITPQELRRECKTVDMASGFLNRFLVLCVRRSKHLPDGGQLDPAVHDALVHAFAKARTFAQTVGRITRDAEAHAHWHAVYPQLTEARPGLVGAIGHRASAHVLRLSGLYALADQSSEIRLVHQRAALAVWACAEASIAQIFGRRVGDRLSDYLLAVLRTQPDGVTRTQLHEALGRHRKADEIHEALERLLELGVARTVKEPPGAAGGRPVERWFVVDVNDRSAN